LIGLLRLDRSLAPYSHDLLRLTKQNNPHTREGGTDEGRRRRRPQRVQIRVELGPIILTYENRPGGFFTYHGFLTITTLSRIISLDLMALGRTRCTTAWTTDMAVKLSIHGSSMNEIQVPALATSGKTGFHSSHLSQTKFDPRLKGPSVPVQLKIWAMEH
jgi:hypothetical protein